MIFVVQMCDSYSTVVFSMGGKVISARWKGDLSWYRRFNPQGGPFAKQIIFFKVLQ